MTTEELREACKILEINPDPLDLTDRQRRRIRAVVALMRKIAELKAEAAARAC